MGVRLFDWRDLPALHRYRKEGVFLDSALLVTRGPLLVPGVLLSYLAPTMGVCTCIYDAHSEKTHALGQFILIPGNQLSHLTFLAPDCELEPGVVCSLLEYMMVLAGERGALRRLADVDERTSTFEALRRCGFAIYNRQRVWRLGEDHARTSTNGQWRVATDRDSIPVRNLYNNLVPGLVQQAELFPSQRPRGMVFYHKDELLAYVELKTGHRGVWAQPFIHPDAEEVADHLVELVSRISGRSPRPIFICVRSYQSWLEPAIEALGAEVGPLQAVMARQLVIQQKVRATFGLPALETGQPEITAPIARLESSKLYGTKENN